MRPSLATDRISFSFSLNIICVINYRITFRSMIDSAIDLIILKNDIVYKSLRRFEVYLFVSKSYLYDAQTRNGTLTNMISSNSQHGTLDFDSWHGIQHGANGPRYVTSSYSTWIFCRGVSVFATDCPCGVWCRGLTTCLLHVGPPFGNRILNNSWAVGLT